MSAGNESRKRRRRDRADRTAHWQLRLPDEPRRGGAGEKRLPPTAAIIVAAALYALLPDALHLGPRLL